MPQELQTLYCVIPNIETVKQRENLIEIFGFLKRAIHDENAYHIYDKILTKEYVIEQVLSKYQSDNNHFFKTKELAESFAQSCQLSISDKKGPIYSNYKDYFSHDESDIVTEAETAIIIELLTKYSEGAEAFIAIEFKEITVNSVYLLEPMIIKSSELHNPDDFFITAENNPIIFDSYSFGKKLASAIVEEQLIVAKGLLEFDCYADYIENIVPGYTKQMLSEFLTGITPTWSKGFGKVNR